MRALVWGERGERRGRYIAGLLPSQDRWSTFWVVSVLDDVVVEPKRGKYGKMIRDLPVLRYPDLEKDEMGRVKRGI
jgi:hypothetical protein